MNKSNLLKFFLSIALLVCVAQSGIHAETKESRGERKNEIRVGWGDQLFETLVWHETQKATILPPTTLLNYDENFQYLQHYFIEYQRRYNHWLSYGGTFDFSGVYWDRVTRNGKGEQVGDPTNHHFINLVFMPNIRFTYFYHKYVSFYSGLGAGLNINTGTEIDYKQRKTAVAPVFGLTLFGVEVGLDHWFASLELGGLYSLVNTNEIYMVSSRMITAAIGFRF